MPESDVFSGGAMLSLKPMSLLYDLLRVRKAKEASVTEYLVAQYGEEGRLPEEELVTRFRKCRSVAQSIRNKATAIGRETGATRSNESADLLRKAARLESRSTRYQAMLAKRVEAILVRAAERLYPKGTFAYQELRDDFLVIAATRLNNAINTSRPGFEIRFVSALMSVIGTSVKSVRRADDRGDDGRRKLPLELDAPVGQTQGDDATGTLADTLVAPSKETPEAMVLLESTTAQLRMLVVAALPQHGGLAHRKFDVLCLRFANLKPAEVRAIIATRHPGAGYSPESERLDHRQAVQALKTVLIEEGDRSLETKDSWTVIGALRLEGQRIALESEAE